ncbi:MAG: hypothetical protein EOO77_17870 [Oxalobacteraceae bacterium]|nr:MAG: hypothetical protein EOO77_17870 [Oxalobacteraceae bacterium]
MHLCLKRWIAGQRHDDPHDPEWSATRDGILNHRGLPVGIAYENLALGGRDHIIASGSRVRDKIAKALGARYFVEYHDLPAVVSGFAALVITDQRRHFHCLNRIYETNKFLDLIGARPRFASGHAYVDNDDSNVADELTHLLYVYRGSPAEYFFYTKHADDVAVLNGSTAFHYCSPYGHNWWLSRNEHEATLFRIGAVSALCVTVEKPLRTGEDWPLVQRYYDDAVVLAASLLET